MFEVRLYSMIRCIGLDLIFPKVANFTCCSFAIALTAFRLVERARHKKLGADDAWAAFAMCAVILLMIILELHVEPQTASLPRVCPLPVDEQCKSS
jgi:hypothetical protein